jgi:hypothetical protein
MHDVRLFRIQHFLVIGVGVDAVKLVFFYDLRTLRGGDVAQSADALLRGKNALNMIAANGSTANDGNSESGFHDDIASLLTLKDYLEP